MDKDSTVNLSTGSTMPVIGLGTWQMENTVETIVQALEMGYAMIDTSGDYGTQPGIGQGLKQSQLDRDAFYLVSKVEETDDAYQASIKNIGELDVDYVNLMLIHRPPLQGVGQELWQGLQQARDEGLVKDIGVSNYSIAQLRQLIDKMGEVPVVNQIEWSPVGHSQEMLDFARDSNMVIQAYSPLTRGSQLDNETIEEIAGRYDKTSAQVALRWDIQQGVVPIPKANTIQHLQQNIDVFDFELTDEEMATISGLNRGYSSLGGSLSYIDK